MVVLLSFRPAEAGIVARSGRAAKIPATRYGETFL
jgi:hypothetical protein